MSILTEFQIKEFRNSTRTFSLNVNASLEDFRGESKYQRIKIFLSHKHDEKELLDGAISFLKKQGVDVYVDWMDDGMPVRTNGITAKRIKEKIKENDKFILLSSEAAINSKWCNWELGLGDAEKYVDNIALLPMSKGNTSYSGAEYLQIYPHIEYENGSNKYSNGDPIYSGYYVIYYTDDGTRVFTPIERWLRR